MKIIIAPDSFKECMTAAEVANTIEVGLKQILPDADCVKVPVADGGEGTMQSLVDATCGRIVNVDVTGPMGETVAACYGMLGDGKTAVIEMAMASGIELVPAEKRNPLMSTTYGTGELIRHALDQGIKRMIVGIGGSATNDGGAGMMQALGASLLDSEGKELIVGGAALAKLAKIDTSGLDSRLASVEFVSACDVDNPLTGANGASAVFGPQKGATPEMVKQLDAALKQYATVIERDLGVAVEHHPGAGAAGGMGAGLLAFMKADLQPGIDIVMDAVELAPKMDGADLVITGEGRIDGQTAQGKTPVGVARIAKQFGLPVVALSGCVGAGVEAVYGQGIDALFPIIHASISVEEALAAGEENLVRAARNLASTLTLLK
ncbi:glycerate kinase [Sansalvadorimonas verongulae]|uniref:glycerate kinase n=1 Tax=Sansalvadorimonas verongulae TaxID=2172824 RepID=UPI0012BD7A73|nr:glycerate kinase [Sansalvadorimonas verongulae]MTI12216.1 glycerate kinase [Sansalvadorimonas verongulae]